MLSNDGMQQTAPRGGRAANGGVDAATACSLSLASAPLLIPVLDRRNMTRESTVVAVGVLLLIACDRFFSIEAIVTDCATQVPVSGVKATLKLDRGVGEPDRTADTGPDGRLRILMNEPLSAWATLTLEKAGYRSWTRQFQGTPSERPVRICLQKLPAREASVKGER